MIISFIIGCVIYIYIFFLIVILFLLEHYLWDSCKAWLKEAFLWRVLAFASAWCLKILIRDHLKINSQLESFSSLAANPDEDQFVSMNSQEGFLFLSIQCQNPNRQVSLLFFPYSKCISLLLYSTSGSAIEHHRPWKLFYYYY